MGNIGLLHALKTFRDSSEDRFPVHATPLIERAIVEAINASDLNRFPRRVP